MRVLFTCVAATGHFHPLVPIARALADAGHEVAFATHVSFATLVERSGYQHLPSGSTLASPEGGALLAEMTSLVQVEHTAFASRRIFADFLAKPMADDLLALLETWPADLIVSENLELAGGIVAERLNLPHASVSVLAVDPRVKRPDWLAEPLDALRTAHGLPPDPELAMFDRGLTLHPFPPSFLRPDVPRPAATTYFIRPTPFDRSGDERMPTWMNDLPVRPTVYATLGTAFNGRTDIFAAFLAGLRDEPVNLVVTVGRDQDPAQFGPQPPHVRIERYIPQTQIFSRCDLVLTHGGSGTVMAALTHALPLVVVPISADQPDNAARCVALGLGRAVPAEAATPASIRDAVRAVLADASYRRAAERLRAEIHAMPGPEHAVSQLERLALDGRAVA
jgi:UDP:flavonoid glycosyltransferase YjiC (YdhE family)